MNITKNSEIKYRFNNPTYLGDERFSIVNTRCNSIVSGSHIGFTSKIDSILASIGEFFEREAFMPIC